MNNTNNYGCIIGIVVTSVLVGCFNDLLGVRLVRWKTLFVTRSE